MKVELRKISCDPKRYKDSHNFLATLYIDGKPRCTVEDDGNGGSLMFRPLPGQDYALCRATELELEAYAKTLPPIKCHAPACQEGEPALDWELPESAETLINGLLGDWIFTNEVKRTLQRDMRKNWVFTKQDDGEELYMLPKNSHPTAKALRDVRPGTDKILNEMPLTRAVDLVILMDRNKTKKKT